jgi:bacteriocin-like protein
MRALNDEICELSIDELNGVSGGTTGGISVTHGGGNMNVAKGPLSESDASTTLGGIAGRHGIAITNGGNNRNT